MDWRIRRRERHVLIRGSLDEFAVLDLLARADEGDEMECVHGAPAGLGRFQELKAMAMLAALKGDHPRTDRITTVPQVMVTDLQHFLDLSPDTPGPARRLAEQLGTIVRAATAGDTGTAWETALTCRRRPGHRACPGRMIVLRTDPATPIRWQCSACNDTGMISNWEDSPFDLRRHRLSVAEPAHDILITPDTAAALRDLPHLDPDNERLVFRARAHPHGAVLSATDEDLDELIGAVAAEANHEPNQRRQQRLDAAFDELTTTAADGR